jgi:hypothetical protein
MADEVRKTNPYIRYGLLAIVLVLFIYNYIERQKPLVHTGNLEYRMVAGTRDGQFQIILIETSDRYVILDSAYREVLISEDGELISRPKQLALMEKYQNIEYRVGFNEEESGTKPGYRSARELFNSLRFGVTMTYEINKKQPDSLVQIIP